MTEIIETLRAVYLTHPTVMEAADEIERLRELLRGVGANRYWEGRWRDERAEVDRLKTMILDACRVLDLYDLPEHAHHYRRELGVGGRIKDGSG